MNRRPDVRSQDGQIFTQIEPVAQFLERFLAGSYFRAAGGRFEPARKNLFSGLRARRAQQLEERSFAEDIQVRRIGVRFVHVARRMSTPDPTILDPVESILVKGNGSLRPALHLKYAFVEDHQGQKQNDWAEQPPWRQYLTRKTQPNGEDK